MSNSRFPLRSQLTVLLALLLAACTAVLILQAAPARAAYPGMNGLIAFDMPDGGGQSQVWTIHADGSGLTQLTHASAGFVGSPAFSPDGKTIAYVDDDRLISMNSDGSERTDLIPTDSGDIRNSEPTWSPDGASIIVSRIDYDIVSPQSDLYAIPAAGGTPQDLTNTAGVNETNPAYSPLGDSIAYIRGADLWSMDAAGTNQSAVSSAIGSITAPAWSPNGGHISFTANQGGSDSDFWTVAAGTTNFDQLTSTASMQEDASAWAPDGSKLVGSVEVRNSTEPSLYLIDKTNGDATLIANTDFADHPDWGPAVPSAGTSPPGGGAAGAPPATLLPGMQGVTNPIKFSPPPSSVRSPFFPSIASHKPQVAVQGAACVSISSCMPAAHAPHNTCLQAVGGNPDVVVTASCLIETSMHQANGGWDFVYTSSGPVLVNGVEMAPTGGHAVTVQMHTGSNTAQSFRFSGNLAHASFESVILARGNTTWDVIQRAGGGFLTLHNGSDSAPVPSGSTFEGLDLAGATLPGFHAGKATIQTFMRIPTELGGGTSAQPLTLTNGSVASAMAAGIAAAGGGGNLPLLQTGSAADEAANCATAMQSKLPTGPGRLTLEVPEFHLLGIPMSPAAGSGLMLAGPDHFIIRLRSSLPYPFQDQQALGAMIEVYQGDLRFACATGDFSAGKGLPALPVSFAHLDLGFGSGAAHTVSGHIKLNAGKQIPGITGAPMHLEGGVTVSVPTSGSDPWTLTASGNLEIADFLGFSGSLTYASDGYLIGHAATTGITALGFTFDKADIHGGMDQNGAWSFGGQSDTSWDSLSIASGALEISNLGFGACGGATLGHVGFTSTWNAHISPVVGFGSCEGSDLSEVTPALLPTCQQLRFNASLPVPYMSESAAQMLASGTCVNVPGSAPAPLGSGARTASVVAAAAKAAGQFPAGPGKTVGLRVEHAAKTQLFVFHGAGGAPLVTLLSPDGRTISATHPGSGTGDAHSTVVDMPASGETIIAVRGAKTGAWLAHVEAGSPAVVSAGLASQLAPPRIHAAVKRLRGEHFALRYSTKGLAGRPLTFVERGRGGREQELGRARHTHGMLRFTPFDGPGGRRTIIARVGKRPPFARRAVARYRAGAPRRLASPHKLRVRRSGHNVKISFTRLHGAVAYRIVVRTNDGRNVTLTGRKHTLSIPLPHAGHTRVTATVAGIDHVGRRGRAARHRGRISIRSPRLKRPARRR